MASGQGTLMLKFDVASAYLNVTIHSRHLQLLGMWGDKYYVGMTLPIYLHS